MGRTACTEPQCLYKGCNLRLPYRFLSFKCQVYQSLTGYLLSHMTWTISDMNPDFSRRYLVLSITLIWYDF